MTNLISTFQDRFGDWVTALSQHLQLSLLTLYWLFYLLFASVLSSISWEVGGLGLADYGDHPVSSLIGALYPFDGNWDLACWRLLICTIFPILQNTITGLKELTQVYKRLGLPLGWPGGSVSSLKFHLPCLSCLGFGHSGLDYRYSNLSCLDWCRGLGSFILWELTAIIPVDFDWCSFSSAVLAIAFNSY